MGSKKEYRKKRREGKCGQCGKWIDWWNKYATCNDCRIFMVEYSKKKKRKENRQLTKKFEDDFEAWLRGEFKFTAKPKNCPYMSGSSCFNDKNEDYYCVVSGGKWKECEFHGIYKQSEEILKKKKNGIYT